MDNHLPKESLADDNSPLLGEMMLGIIAYIMDGGKEDVEDSLTEDHSSLFGEMMQRIISSFSGSDIFGRELYLLDEQGAHGYCRNHPSGHYFV